MPIKKLKPIFVISELVLVFIVVFLFYFGRPIHLASAQMKIPPGNISSTLLYLNRHHIPVTKIDEILIRRFGYPQKGWIDLKTKSLTRLDFLYQLTTAKAPLFALKVIPGETTLWLFRMLSKKYGYSEKVLRNVYLRLAPYPEGVIFADTYLLPKGIHESDLVRYLVKQGILRHKKLAIKVYGKYDQKFWFEKIVTIASIIQKEAANKEEMPIIASVIYNRLKRKIPLQMDGTLNYGLFSHQKITPERIKKDTTPFNTYRHLGLPPYPVCIVGLDAIKAAIKPAKTNYLYFVKGANGRHKFTNSYKKHLLNIQSVKNRNKKR